MKKLFIIVLLAIMFPISALSQDWNSSPDNWDNSTLNWENSPIRWENSPMNWDNSTMKWGNDRIVRDNQGQPLGYVVPKKNGGANIYDADGNRKAYIPPSNRLDGSRFGK